MSASDVLELLVDRYWLQLCVSPAGFMESRLRFYTALGGTSFHAFYTHSIYCERRHSDIGLVGRLPLTSFRGISVSSLTSILNLSKHKGESFFS